MSTLFDRGLTPPNSSIQFVDEQGRLSMDGVAYLNELFSWICGGYVMIPCDCVMPDENFIQLTPRFRPERSAIGYVHLQPFSFIATANSDDDVTIEVIGGVDGERSLGELPLYAHATRAGDGDISRNNLYIVFFCEANDDLPDRMVKL